VWPRAAARRPARVWIGLPGRHPRDRRGRRAPSRARLHRTHSPCASARRGPRRGAVEGSARRREALAMSATRAPALAVASASAARLVTLAQPRSPAAEAYRTLRTNLRFSAPDHTLRVVLVTSAGVGEGKSTVLANLAVVSAETGARVVALDTDLRRPTLHELFGVARAPGLTDAVLSGPGHPPVLQDTGVPNLHLLTSGTPAPNPAEVLASQGA